MNPRFNVRLAFTRSTLAIGLSLAIFVGLFARAAPVRAGGDFWLPNGNPLSTAGNETTPTICGDGAGGAFVAWEDHRSDQTIYLTHILGNGAIPPGWPVDGLALPGAHSNPLLLLDGTGGVYVAWGGSLDPHGSASFLERITSDGAIASGWPSEGLAVTVNLPLMDAGVSALLSDGAGGVVVVSIQTSTFPRMDDRVAQHILPDGTRDPTWPSTGRSLLGMIPDLVGASAYSDEAGGIFLVWTTLPGDLRVLHFTPSGIVDPAWPPAGLIPYSTPGYHGLPGLALDGLGGGYVCWTPGFFTETDDYVQHFTASGTVASGWNADGNIAAHVLSPGGGMNIVSDGSGGAFMAWDEWGVPFLPQVHATRILSDGTRPAGWPLSGVVVSATGNQQEIKGAISDGEGGLLTCWVEHVGSTTDIFVQRTGPDGLPVVGWPTTGIGVCTDPFNQDLSVIATDGAGGAVVAWRDFRNGDDGAVYAGRVRSDAVTPVEASIARSEAASDHASLVWYLPGRGGATVEIERAAGGAAWATCASITADGLGYATYEDRGVVPGSRYGYRMVVHDVGVRRALGEVWLDIPLAAAFSLRGVIPNPARGPVVVEFSLPDRGAGRVEVFDVGGRRVLTRDIGALEAGAHRLSLADPTGLRPGVYLLVLTHSGKQRAARFAMTD